MDPKVAFLILTLTNRVLLEQRPSSEAQDGRCIPLHACPKVFDTFANPPVGSEDYLRRSLCKSEQGLHVCCDTPSNITMLADQHATHDTAYTKLLVRHAFPTSGGGYFSQAVLPVILEKNRCSWKTPKCFGALLNSRYVITTAECIVRNNTTQKFEITHVRFPLRNKKSYVLAIEEKIPHPFYDPVTGINDLALLRLNETISEDDVTPLHMSITWDTKNVKPGSSLTSYKDLNISATSQWQIKTLSSAKLLSGDLCSEMFYNKSRNAPVANDYHLCTEDFKPRNGFTGVPLFYDGSYDYIIGISTQKTVCLDDLPNVYTNLVVYKEWLMNNMRPWPINNEQCTTPNGDPGQCMYILYCSLLFEAFTNAKEDDEEYLRKFYCKKRTLLGDAFVCCPTGLSFTLEHNSNQQADIDIPAQFLESKLCGMQHRDDYFSSSTAVAIDEFPWIGLIRTGGTGYYRGRCTATLINARYVITGSICAQTLDASEAIVRLGDYSRTNDTDCVVEDAEFQWIDCSDTEVFGIEEIIVNPFFKEDPHFQRVGLLRLNKTVFYTDFIRPICLPVPGTPLAKSEDFLYVSSWGYKETGPREAIKKKVLTEIIPNSECRRTHRKRLSGDLVDDFVLCAYDDDNNTEFISALDEGGALMMDNNYRWHIEGLIHSAIHNRDIPKVYINVSRYTDWIVKNMRPWW